MSRLVLIGGVIVLLCCPVGAAQNASLPPLERVIEKSFSFNPSNVCGRLVPDAVHFLGVGAGVLTGAEHLPGLCEIEGPSGGERIELQGMRVEDALNKLIEIDPRFRWVESGGVIVVRPVAAWSDPNNVLNRQSNGFAMESGNFARALSLWHADAFGGESASLNKNNGKRDHAKRKFGVDVTSLSLGAALDAIVRAHGALNWMVYYKTAPAGIETTVVTLYGFDAEGALTQQHPR